MMDCDICSRDFTARREPICTSCAQAIVYNAHVQQASALLSREKQHSHAEALVRPGNDGVIAALPEDVDLDSITGGGNRIATERMRQELATVELRISDITGKAEELRAQIESYKEYAIQQKKKSSKQKEELDTESKRLGQHKSNAMDPVRSAIRKAQSKYEKVHSRTAEARRLLCWEAAALGGMSRLKGKDGRYEYWLGGVPIFDLRHLDQKAISTFTRMDTQERVTLQPHDLLSASLDNICRLLGSCCYHLAIRLPAEIVLPHGDFPHAVIMPEKSSYKVSSPPYPGKSLSRSASPAASRFLDSNGTMLSRPRLLHLDRPLPQLLKEDSKAFRLFVEGVMLLAWNIAWLCRTQGLDNVNTFDEVCDVGKNLYQLFLGEHQVRPSLSRNPSSATAGGSRRATTFTSTAAIPFGLYTHGSAQHSLSGHEGAKLVRGWRLASPARLVDKLNSYLLNEISGAEWDFLSGEDWDEEREEQAAAVEGGEQRLPDVRMSATRELTVSPNDNAATKSRSVGREREGGVGWTKIRGPVKDD